MRRPLLSKLALAAVAVASGALALPVTAAASGVSVIDTASGSTPSGLAESLVGGGVSISNVAFTGSPRSAGSFTAGSSSVGFERGIVMSSGKVQTYPEDEPCSRGVEGPNTCYEASGEKAAGPSGWENATSFELPGDEALSTLSGFPTFDASVLEFDFVPQHPTVQFSYVFSSDEYSDYSNTPYNDVFAFYVNGSNCALVPGSGEPVAVNTINNGNDQEGADATPHHPELFRDNVRPEPSIASQMDGLTTMLTCTAGVNPGQSNHMRLAISDASDPIFDSAVFIASDSLVSGTQIATQLTGGGNSGEKISVKPGTAVTDHGLLSGAGAAGATGTVTYKVYADPSCTTLHATAGTVPIAGGTAPPSNPQTLPAGTWYWQASYSGDASNNASLSECGAEVETVTPEAEEEAGGEADPTTIVTQLSGGGKSAGTLSVPAGTAVSDLATLKGSNVPEAGGTVSYSVYSDAACTSLVASAGSVTVNAGVAGASQAVTLSAGTYYWQAAYGGDPENLPSKSACGTEVEIVSGEEQAHEGPEFGRCEKVAKGTGQYSSSSCTVAGGTKSYRWTPGVEKPHIAITGKAAKLETAAGLKVACKAVSGAGAYTGTTTVGNVSLVFTGCTLGKATCGTPGAAPGEVAAATLAGELGVISLGETQAQNAIGLLLHRAAGPGAIATVSCGASTVGVRGSVIVAVKTGKPATSAKLHFAIQSAGHQQPEALLGGPPQVLEASLGGAGYQQASLRATMTATSEEAVEVNPVL
ncbi:MAG TPA: choice-of-anchor L domain-containing protein [Solirubrobacteraceae bacterium]|nr:choice-of-anchor L domain-containing protein [Solirubrobacteraceae bacterium]